MFQILVLFFLFLICCYTFQILPYDLGAFLRTINHDYLRVCGGSNTITICKLEFKMNVITKSRKVMITRGWCNTPFSQHKNFSK